MAQIRVQVKFKIKDMINRFVDSQTKRDIGEAVVAEMKDLISKGISPVRDAGRFAPYKATEHIAAAKKVAKVARAVVKSGMHSAAGKRASAKLAQAKATISSAKRRGYPFSVMGKYPGKSVTPVNLELSGDTLTELSWAEGSGNSLLVGMVNGGKAAKIIAAHNQGTKHMAARPVIPGDGEEFVVRIMRIIKALYAKRVSAIIGSSNK